MKEKIVARAIELIDEKGGARGVGLREIARRAGCAAPNIYNYFPDFKALLNEAHLHLIADFNEKVPGQALRASSPLGRLTEAIKGFIGYALDHRGWFNCFYYEKHDFPANEDTDRAAEDAGNRMADIARAAGGDALRGERAFFVTRVIHGFLLGELSSIVTGKLMPPDPADYKEKLLRSCLVVFRALVESPAPKTKEVLS